jgi:hypothetical protein
MTCKYKDHPFPPCQFTPHPHDSNIYFCPHCRDSYDVREVANPFSKWLMMILAITILMVFIKDPQFFQPEPDYPLPVKHTQAQ